MDDTVICLVRGPGSRYPRGFVWLVPLWFAGLSVIVVALGVSASGSMPLWIAATELGALSIAATTLFCVLLTIRRRAFRADSRGIWLGIPTTRKRPRLRQVHLDWGQIARLQLKPKHYGVWLEIALSPAARTDHRAGPLRQGLLLLGALVLPFAFGRGRPALTTPSGDPPRYRLKICDADAAELHQALMAVRPPTVPVLLVLRRGVLQLVAPPPPQAMMPPPPAAVG